MPPCERADWFSIGRAFCRIRAFDRSPYHIRGMMPFLYGTRGSHAVDLINYIEDFLESDRFDLRAVCQTKLVKSGICCCAVFNNRETQCTERYFADFYPDLSHTLPGLNELARRRYTGETGHLH